jgi:hypothetical protein
MDKPSSMPLLKLFILPILFGLGLPGTTVSKQPRARNAAPQEMFNYLRCHRQAKNIVVNWGMTSQLGVTKFIVYHSEDNEFFDPIYEIDIDPNSLKYSFKHTSIFAGYHYYYIAAVRSSMPRVNSITDVVRIVGH